MVSFFLNHDASELKSLARDGADKLADDRLGRSLLGPSSFGMCTML